MPDTYWEVVFYDGEIVTSDMSVPQLIPDKPIIIILQLFAITPEILENGGQWYFSKRHNCWMEMESDFVSLATKLRIECDDWVCYRPGWWLIDRSEWKEWQYWARKRLKELKEGRFA